GFAQTKDMPYGIYTVHQAQPSAGFLMGKDFRINVHADLAVQTFPIELTPVGSATGTVDVAVVPYDGTTGGGLTGACVQFEGGSLVGCDDNGDGRIDFKGLPVGTYQLVETQAPAGYALASPHFVSVTQSGRIYYLEHFPDNQAQPFSNVDVALVTRDPDSGDLLMGACYIILDASVEGCDENSDGQVDYKGVAPGTYTVHQTKAPNGFNLINDFNIQISQFDPTQSILIKQAPEQFTPGHRNVSVAVWDIDTGQRITGPDICVQLAEWSNVGCDTNSDGQIDFQDVPVGTYPINVISLPDGYRVHFATNKVVVEESNPFSIANALLTVEGT
ncbi:MAG TPA: SpaA isopeptide-forming pilin-related protein, partial [Thermomicrobiales bacterium]|nr:SpaA isopeptide-forming pilin-related protein [Thermomicrobiales bacterium]